jgi:hypothetical protein
MIKILQRFINGFEMHAVAVENVECTRRGGGRVKFMFSSEQQQVA